MIDCKAQILSTITDNNCCSLAFAHAVLYSSSQIDIKKHHILVSNNNAIINKLVKILNNIYPNLEMNHWDDFLFIRGNIDLLISNMSLDENLNLDLYPNDCDRLTILKALFLTNGRFYYTSDHTKNSTGYNLEFVFKLESQASILTTLLNSYDLTLKKTKRQSNYVIYTKNSNVICDLLVRLGASYTALDVQNNLAMREIRNNANRQNNCFESNLDRTIQASNEQLTAINYIIEHYSLEYLDENLREVALARLANPDVSLQELRILLDNKISRAGIKYRLDKIIDLYNRLKGEN